MKNKKITEEPKAEQKTNLETTKAAETQTAAEMPQAKADDYSQKELAQKELAEMKDLLQRTQANFENYRKQVEKRIADNQQMASREIILQLLPILDNFELALKHLKNEGVEMIYSQLTELLINNGITKIQSLNQKFDPYYHEALMKVNSELPENTIMEEFQKGFMLNNKVIRLAKVKISAGKK